MALGMQTVVLGVALLTLTSTSASRVKVKEHVSETQEHTFATEGTCAENAVKDVCKCDHSSKMKGYQCSGCVDPSKWGYGCKLDCPKQCRTSCDFSGNCPVEQCPANCKRNSRMSKTTDKDVCINDEGLCQACVSGFHGLMCESACPEGCKESTAEGKCKRNGDCYSCQSGFYGAMCDQACPEACPKCMQYDGVDDSGMKMPAGSCLESCKADKYGTTCEIPCPEKCDKSVITGKKHASCSRDKGVCDKCQKGWWGDQCTNQCSDKCVGGKCAQEDGKCTDGCKPGYWGAACDKKCPDFFVEGCDRETGEPKACDESHYKETDPKGNPVCLPCPFACVGGKCDDNGVCAEGCEEIFFGDMCDKMCPEDCVGGCDRKTGQCNACRSGKTGKFCKQDCHTQCATCTQFTTVSQGVMGVLSEKQPGIETKDCMTCPLDEPSELSGGAPTECACIKGASRPEKAAACACDRPDDDFQEAFFERDHNFKKCGSKCSDNHNGKALKAVYGKDTRKCIYFDLYNSVIVAGMQNGRQPPPTKGQSPCTPDEYAIAVNQDDKDIQCLREEFVKHILGIK